MPRSAEATRGGEEQGQGQGHGEQDIDAQYAHVYSQVAATQLETGAGRDEARMPVLASALAWAMVQFVERHYGIKLLESQTRSPMIRQPVVGILTGISYVSGVDYYKNINEQYGKLVGKRHIMPPNPTMLLASCDCDIYAKYLCDEEWDHLYGHVRMLVAGGADFLVIASNTGHMSVSSLSCYCACLMSCFQWRSPQSDRCALPCRFCTLLIAR